MDYVTPRHNPTATDLYREFRRDWLAAMNPCYDCLMRRCPEGEQEALRILIGEGMDDLPTPPYSPIQHDRLAEQMAPMLDRAMNDPSVIAARDQERAAYRDLPRRVRAYRTLRWRLYCARLRIKIKLDRTPKRWEQKLPPE